MDHLTGEQIETLRNKLLSERATIVPPEPVAPDEPPTPDVGDIQDAAATEAAQLTERTLAEHAQARLRDIDSALQRIREGTYGICEVSDEPIPAARLLAFPTARTTVEAQAQLEREQALVGNDPDDLRRAY
jgi:DnaK suppressor protein